MYKRTKYYITASLLIFISILFAVQTCMYDSPRNNPNETPTCYTVTYNGNGNESGNVPIDTTNYEESQTVTVVGNTGNLVKTGYPFGGWNTMADGSGTTYTAGQTFTMGSANVNLYANWGWTKLLGVCVSGAELYGYGISVDTSGNSYVTGWTYGDLDGQTLIGIPDVFVIKYNTSGTKQWTRLSGVSGASTIGCGISVDSSGNNYVTGWTHGALDGQTLIGTRDVFIIKYDTSGNKQWTRLSGVSGANTYGRGISVDSGGNSYVTGQTNGALDGQTFSGGSDVFVIKYNTTGNKQWTRLSGVSGAYTGGYGISVDSSGNNYVTGWTAGDLDGQTLTGTDGVFVIKYDTSGNKQWTRLSGVSGVSTQGYGISVDSSGNCYVTGNTRGDLDGQISIGTMDVFIIKYNTSGNKQWTRLLGVLGAWTRGFAISIDSGGNSYVTGETEGNLDGQTLLGTCNDSYGFDMGLFVTTRLNE